MNSFLRIGAGVVALGLMFAASCKSGESTSGGGGPSCPATSQVCNGACVDVRFDPTNCGACGTACAAGEVCVDGTCGVSCPSGSETCELDGKTLCADVKVDRNHCGGCGKACGPAEVCVDGACALECAGGATKCDGANGPACVDTKIDEANCGGCGTSCAPGLACIGGVCETKCVGGTKVCSVPVDGGGAGGGSASSSTSGAGGSGGAGGAGGAGGGATSGGGGSGPTVDVCVDTKNDPQHCGDCNQACPKGQVCQDGVCLTGCTGGTTKCQDANQNDVCVKLDSDPSYCGSCDNACPAGKVCQIGFCVTDCVGNTTKCQDGDGKDVCVDLKNNPSFCGKCDTACATGDVCQDGTCVTDCVGNTTKCGAICTNTSFDPNNCGSCDNACAQPTNATGFCSAATCGFSCKSGFGDCNNSAGDGCELALNTNTNCGACGKVCSFANATGACTNGACVVGVCNQNFGNCNNNGADGCEQNLLNDANHCGMCGTKCAAGEICADGMCKSNTCKVVPGAGNLTWCMHANGTQNTSCTATCQSVGKVPVSDQGVWFNAQNSVMECSAIRDAFGLNGANVNLGDLTTACAVYVPGGNIFGCSSNLNCPGTMTNTGPAGGAMAVCPCQ
jgi:hypothetical protein